MESTDEKSNHVSGNDRSGRPSGSTTRAAGSRAPRTGEPPAETAMDVEPEGHTIPGTSLALHHFDSGALRGVPWVNASGLPMDAITPYKAELAAALSMWVEDQKLQGSRVSGGRGSMFDRNAYVPPDNIFDQMRMAHRAVENDDAVGGLADATEAMALNEIHWESEELDDADVMNQWSQMVDLDGFIRACWRENFAVSQYVVAGWWGFHTFKIRGRMAPTVELENDPANPDPEGQKVKVTKGNRKRKKVTLYCPLSLTHLDSTKVIPCGTTMFGMERLCWAATQQEVQVWNDSRDPTKATSDQMMERLFIGQYKPNDEERARLSKMGVNTEFLLEFNPAYVWRCTSTRPRYKPWADLRLKRIFRWLDLKQQLMAADRVAMIGNANYILLVTKGDKDNMPDEGDLGALNEQFAYVAKLPIVIGDYTLKVEIIQPKMDLTLNQEKYNVIDGAIIHSLLKLFRLEGPGSGRGDTTITVGRAVARGLENIRRMIRRDFEQNIGRAIWEHPFNAEAGLEGDDPNLAFSPRNINLDIDQQTMQALIAARQSGDISRRTYLEELNQDEDVEAARRLEDDEYYDMIFKTATPHTSPTQNPFSGDGSGGAANSGGPANSGGGQLPPGQGGGGGRPPGGSKPGTAKKVAATAKKAAVRPARGKNR